MADETLGELRAKQQRMIDIYTKRPSAALSTIAASAVVGEGLRCDFSEGDSSVVVDMPKALGGGPAGPTPGFYARAGLCSCVAIGIKLTAIRGGLDFRQIAVDVEVDFDDGALLGLGERSAAPLETRVSIAIETDASEAETETVVDTALRSDPWFLALRDAQTVTTELTLVE